MKDGGPAFPRPASKRTDNHYATGLEADEQDGMSLRDWFAGMALYNPYTWVEDQDDKRFTAEDIALLSYQVADAMLAERKKES